MPSVPDPDRESESATKPERDAAYWMDYAAERGQIDTKRMQSVVCIAFNAYTTTAPPLFGGQFDG